MMNEEKGEILIKLQMQLGITALEAEAYYYMLLNDVTATHLTNLLNINRSYAYSILKKLMALGFCTEISGTVRQYRATEPNLAFKSHMEKIEKNLDDLKKLSLEVEPLFNKRKNHIFDDMVKILHSSAHILDTINKYEHEAKEEIVAFTKPPYLMDINNLDKVSRSQRNSISRGILHKTIYEIEKGNEIHLIKIIEYFKKAGEEIRISEYLPMKLVVFDSSRVVFTLKKIPGKEDDITFTFFNDENLAKTFRMIFQTYWDSSLTYDEYIKKIKIQ